MTKKAICLLVLLLILYASFGCQNIREQRQIIIQGDTLTVSWDPSIFNSMDSIEPLAVYQIYYRRHGQIMWTLISEIPFNEKLEYTMHHEHFGNGMYDFAVRAINVNGHGSKLHASIDHDAEPFGGWYVFWVK